MLLDTCSSVGVPAVARVSVSLCLLTGFVSIMATKYPTVKPRFLARKFICNILHLPVSIKAQVLFAVALVGSLLCAVELNPDTHFSDKKNPLNVYMVKLSWGWTLVCVLPAVLFSSFLYSGLQWGVIVRHFGRIGVAHVIWMIVTSLCLFLDSITGACTSEDVLERSVCLKRGHRWEGFDISGHMFLLTYCIYVITEECANIQLELWYEYNSGMVLEHHVVSKLSEKKQSTLVHLHKIASWVVEPLELLATTEVMLWTLMTAATAFYFHSFLEKLLGFAFGILAWFLTYKCLYGKWSYVPCRPDEGLLHPIKHFKITTSEVS